LPGISKFGAKNQIVFEKKAHTLRFAKGGGCWLVDWAYGPLFGMHVTVNLKK